MDNRPTIAEVQEWVLKLYNTCEQTITSEERKEQHKYAVMVQRPQDKTASHPERNHPDSHPLSSWFPENSYSCVICLCNNPQTYFPSTSLRAILGFAVRVTTYCQSRLNCV